jgi:hypothetical protein
MAQKYRPGHCYHRSMLAAADRGLPPRDGRVPLLSVLITSWNAAPTIERAITSVLEDDRFAVECVVVDDGSRRGRPGGP